MDKIVILTGAGLSAESGMGTFRDKDGIWTRYNLEEVATPQGFARNPALVHQFYNARRAALTRAEPNAAHLALARLDREYPGELLIITQNVDDLHERAGTQRLLHMHGELRSGLCNGCGHRWRHLADMETTTPCPRCGARGTVRPDVVWFGEWPYHMEQIDQALRDCDLFVSIGTSGAVYPAADYVRIARQNGARTIELNLERSANAALFTDAVYGPATQVVPPWVERVLSGREETRNRRP